MKISRLTKASLITMSLALLFLGVALFAELPYYYAQIFWLVSVVFHVATFYLTNRRNEQAKKEHQSEVKPVVV